MNPLFALVDVNNFYVSCERVFQPKLENVPDRLVSFYYWRPIVDLSDS